MRTEELQAAVVDASVGAKLFVSEAGSEQADRLFSRLALDPPASFFVPDLFYVECANILWKYARRYGYPVESARKDVLNLQSLALRGVPTADLVADALDLVLTFDITAYDASYAALALRLALPLVTADASLGQKLKESGVVVYLLGDL